MARKKIFVVSSAEAMAHAKSFIKSCKDDERIEYHPWWDLFQPGRTLIQELVRFKRKLDGALVILTPDLKATLQGNEMSIPNLNVLFEFGFFLSRFGSKHVAVVKYGDVYLPSDLDGVIPIYGAAKYSKRPTKVSKRTKDEFVRWVDGFKYDRRFSTTGKKPSAPHSPSVPNFEWTKQQERRYKLQAWDFDAFDVDITETIEESTRLKFTLDTIAKSQTYVLYFHFRTSQNEQGWIGITNQSGEKHYTGSERSSPESKDAMPGVEMNVMKLIQSRWPELKGTPVVIDRLRLRGDKAGKTGVVHASAWIY